LTTKILSGYFPEGGVLQPVHIFAKEQKVSLSTVERAYEELKKEGLITFGNDRPIVVNTPSLKRKQAFALQTKFAGSDENRRLHEELVMAQEIQASLLPKSLPSNSRLQVAAYAEASRPIGGDFYDYLPIDDDRFGIIIADACGSGLPAAMLISQIQAIVKNEVLHRSSIRQTMSNLNHHVRQYGTGRHFVSMFYGVFDDRTGMFEFANAGHHPPMLLRKEGRIEFLKTTAPALNLMPRFDGQMQTAKIERGDNVLFYTDGVTETMNCAREEYGEHRLADAFIRHRHTSAHEIVRSIVEEFTSFQSPALAPDDRTLLVFKLSEDSR
jgi:sigma-B regulation protein RsbU (phosphoserine phosphatase)